MAQEGRPYDEVLAGAQELGYAEADPTGDVEGDDAVNKLVILARLAFGRVAGSGDRRATSADGPRRRQARHHRRHRPGARGSGGARADDQAARHGRRAAAMPIEASVRPDRGAGRQPVRLDRRRHATASRSTPSRWARSASSGPGAGGPATSSAVLGDLRGDRPRPRLARGPGCPRPIGPAVGRRRPVRWPAPLVRLPARGRAGTAARTRSTRPPPSGSRTAPPSAARS